jgi:hypothetical protein
MSLALRPLLLKRDISLSRLSVKRGRSLSAKDKLAVVESLLPSFTFQDGPPTATDASRAATARISAQDTTPGHIFSTAAFALSMTS